MEALYEYELPEPGNWAQIFSHDGLDQFPFQCPDRRILPSIQENRMLLKFFAFFELTKLKQIFTALLLERKIIVVSRDLENLSSCCFSLEYLLYPLEWLQPFVPIVPESIDLWEFYFCFRKFVNFFKSTRFCFSILFEQPIPFIYGTHHCIYEKLNPNELKNCVVILVDERKVVYGSNISYDRLPQNVDDFLTKRLDYFRYKLNK